MSPPKLAEECLVVAREPISHLLRDVFVRRIAERRRLQRDQLAARIALRLQPIAVDEVRVIVVGVAFDDRFETGFATARIR
jgi:hypothetical protein